MVLFNRISIAIAALLAISSTGIAHAAEMNPRYQHIFVIIMENKGHDQIMSHPNWTPQIHKLASEYGQASQFYGEVHSSEGNYIAMVGGTPSAFMTMIRSSVNRDPAANFVQRPISRITSITTSRREA